MIPESTELAIATPAPPRKGRTSLAKPSSADRARWFLFRSHVPIDEIAKRHGVKIEAIQKSIDRMEAYKAQTSNEIVDMRRNEMTLNLVDKTEQSLSRALGAQVIVRRPSVKNPDKMVIVSKDPDFKTQAEAANTVKELLMATIPKGGGVNIALQQNQGLQAESKTHRNFEERLRLQREKRGLSNGMEVQDAEYEDVDETADEDEDEGEDAVAE